MLRAIVAARSAVVDDHRGDRSVGGAAASLRRSRPLRAEGHRLGRRRCRSAPPAWRRSDARGRLAPCLGPLRKGAGRAGQGQGNRRRRPAADGTGPALPGDGQTQAGGRVLRPRDLRARSPRRVRSRRATQEIAHACRRAGPQLPTHRRVLSGRRSAGGREGGLPEGRPGRPQQGDAAVQSCPRVRQDRQAGRGARGPGGGLRRTPGRPGRGALRDLGRGARQTRQESGIDRPAGETPQGRTRQTRRWAIFWRRSTARPESSTRPRRCISPCWRQAHAHRLRQPDRDISAAASDSTPCWP